MKRNFWLISVLFGTALLLGCRQEPEAVAANEATGESPAPDYVVLDESLQRLKDDFNASKGKIRLLFIVGDACGICLRGMADLNDAFIARAQNDDRLLTFVLHVPALGTEERHVAAAIPLLDGPRVLHYWDGVGKSGIHFGDALETNGVYAWDVWLAYGPQAEWTDTVPPPPEFWMHQLGPLWPELRLDAKLFGEKTLALMSTIEAAPMEDLVADENALIADGTVIPVVAQPRGLAIGTHIRGVGGYHELKSIRTITRKGSISSSAGSSPLAIVEDRDNGLDRTYADGSSPLPENMEKALADSWEINGLLVDWKGKGHQVRLNGMLKVGTSLAWKLYLRQNNDMRWILYVDSHSGDIVLTHHLDESGNVLFSIKAGSFRVVDGFSMPFSREYLDADGGLIATEVFEDIVINTASAEQS